MLRDRHVAIVGDTQIIGHLDLEAVAAVEPDFGHQYAAARLIVDRVTEPRQRDHRQAENLDPRALVADLVLDPVVHPLYRADLPARVLRTAFVVLDRARSDEHTSDLQSLMRISNADFRL